MPLWFWNSAEWSAFTQASAKTQRPTLIQALRSVRDGSIDAAPTFSSDTRRYLRTLLSALQIERNAVNPWRGAGPAKGFRDRLQRWSEGFMVDASFTQQESAALVQLIQHVAQLLGAHKVIIFRIQ